jgi:excisionase family DNA binding protein
MDPVLLRAALDSMGRLMDLLSKAIEEKDKDAGGTLTVKEVAAELRVSKSYVHQEIKARRLKAERMGPKVWRVRRADLDRYRQQRRSA